MIEQDTVKLLRECDAGIKMGVSSIEEVLQYTKDANLRQSLTESRDAHMQLKEEIRNILHDYHDMGKNPNPLAKGMSWMKTNVMLGLRDSDRTVADLITDGCNMGVKSLSRYLNQYEAASEHSKDIAKRLIRLEEDLCEEARQYL